MGFWSDLFNRDPSGITPNENPSPGDPPTVGSTDYTPGDPDGVDLSAFADIGMESRSLPSIHPSPWDGWPVDWNVPNWGHQGRLNELVDIAWACLDLNTRVLSSMPPYRTRDGETVDPAVWMRNPDPTIYSGWQEFARQLFRDYQLGEAFVMSMGEDRDGLPAAFRVIPPYLVHASIRDGVRHYRFGGVAGRDVTDRVLHIRYNSSTDTARGSGPLETAGGRILTAGVLAKYVREVVKTGGVPAYTLETDEFLDAQDAQDLLNQWVEARAQNLGEPPVLDAGTKLQTHFAMTPRDLAMVEIAQFTEARIAVLLGVPPFLVGLPSTSGAGESLTYSNATSLFDFHDRSYLRTAASYVMEALGFWALPPGERSELDRDEYTRPTPDIRAQMWVQLVDAGIMSVDEVRVEERLGGPAPEADETAEDAPSLAERVNSAGALIRSGFDPQASLTAVGLDPIEHFGLLPVTLQSPKKVEAEGDAAEAEVGDAPPEDPEPEGEPEDE